MGYQRFWLVVFVVSVAVAVSLLVKIFSPPDGMSIPLNRARPFRGFLLGEEPEAWIGDTVDGKVAGKGKAHRPPLLDVDTIKVRGRWYKVRGPVYITKNGGIFGWHRETTLEEAGYLGKRHLVE